MSSVDYVSAINTKGSGLNITQIVESLVEAETFSTDNIYLLVKETLLNLENKKVRVQP